MKQITNLGNHPHISGRDMIQRSLNQLTNKQSFSDVNNVGNNNVNNGQFAQESGDNQFSTDLKKKKIVSC